MKVSLGRGKTTLKAGHEIFIYWRVFTVCTFNEGRQVTKRKSPRERVALSSPSMKETDAVVDIDFDIEEPPIFEDLLANDDSCEMCNEYCFQLKVVRESFKYLTRN